MAYSRYTIVTLLIAVASAAAVERKCSIDTFVVVHIIRECNINQVNATSTKDI